MNNEFVNFQNKLALHGYKEKQDLNNVRCDKKFQILFEMMNKNINETTFLSSYEINLKEEIETTYENEESEIFNFEILELENQINEIEIFELNEEIKDLEKEIDEVELQCEMLEKENINFENNIIPKYENNISEMNDCFINNLKKFENEEIKYLEYKLRELNKSSQMIFSELDLNLKNSINENKILVGIKKFENEKFYFICEIIENVLILLESKFENLNTENNTLNNHQNFKLNDFIFLIGLFEELVESEKQLIKNSLLMKLNYLKEKYKNDYIHSYIKTNQKFSNIQDEVDSNLLDMFMRNELKLSDIKKNTQIEKFCKRIFDEIISKLNLEEISFNENILELEKIIYLLIPFLIIDQNTTQEISDITTDLVERYGIFQLNFANGQNYLRKKFNENIIKNKITIDERDSINLSLCRLLSGSDEIIFKLSDLNHLILNFNNNYSKNKNETKKILIKFSDELIKRILTKFKLNKFLEINKNSQNFSKDVILFQNTINKFKDKVHIFVNRILKNLSDMQYIEKKSTDINSLAYDYIFKVKSEV